MIALGLIRENKGLTHIWNVTKDKCDITTFQELGLISREGGRKDGSWIIKQDEK